MEGWEKTTIATLPPASSFDLSSQGVLVIEENVVRHLSFGGQVIKQYSCEARPLLAIFHTDENCLGLMVVILITSSLIRIFTETGEFYDIPLLFLAKCLLSSSRGIIIESEIICRSLVEETITSRYYIIHRPDAPYVPLQLPRDGRILAVCDSLIALSGKKEISIFSILPHQSNEDLILSLKNDSIISDSISSHYSPATKRIKTKPSRNARHPTSSPESFANALGISGYADTRAISPLSFARIREIDLNRTSITLNTEFSSVYPSMSDESYISAAQHSNHSFDGISYFVLDCLGIISVDTSDNSISFSRDPDGLILVHVLSCDGILKSYRLASDPSMIHLKECILPSRTLSNVSAVIHFHLGKPATALKSYSFLMDLFGTLVIYKQDLIDLVVGFSKPICTYKWNYSDDTKSVSYSSTRFASSVSGILFSSSQEHDTCIHYMCLPKWAWFSRRISCNPLTRTIWDTCLEILLANVCKNPSNSSLAAGCLSFSLQIENQENTSVHAVVLLCLGFVPDFNCHDDLTDLLTFLFPHFQSISLQNFANTLCAIDSTPAARYKLLMVLFQIFHVGLEDQLLHDVNVSIPFLRTMYAAASIFAPSYKAYYRRILSFSEEFMRTVQVLDRKCERLATIFKTKCPNDISLPNISSSHVWITNLLLSNMSPMSQSLQETWNPVSRHICFVLDNLFESGSYDDKFVQYWSHILSPATSLIRCFLLNLSQVTEWFRINQQTRSPTTFALSFLSVCAQYYPMSEEEILQSFPLAFRLAVYQSLLHHRSDIDSLNEFWLQFARTQIHHCGSSSWNSIGLPESLCSPTSNSVDITFAGISKRMLTSLSREDFIANQGGQLPSKGKYQTTDACLFNSFNKISSAKSYYLSEEQECSWIEASVDDSSTHTHLPNSEDLDGLDHAEILSQSRFSEDERIHEVCRLLRSSKNIYLKVERTPEMTDALFRQKQQTKLLSLCRRTLAYPVGRGMLTLNSLNPISAEPIPIPPLILVGRCPPTNATISLDSISPEMTTWPEYHNGVAAGLRIRRNSIVSRNWIIYNRIHALSSQESATPSAKNSHAGFLLSLGLQGHLKALSVADICDYLTKGHELTTISMLLGLSASRIGSSDPLLSKSLCLHLPSLMYPADAGEIYVSPLVQTAALAGLGLLHCSSPNRLIIEYLLTELASPHTLSTNSDTPVNECKEAISLSAGWSLGMLLLGFGRLKADSNRELNLDIHDLRVEDRLQQCIDGGLKLQESHLFPHNFRSKTLDASKSSRVLEGNYINTNITAPGAVLALTLMYLRSNNHDIASHLEVPHTTFALDNIRPDLLIYRAMGSSLVLWDEVEPSDNWLRNKIPKIILDIFFPVKLEEGPAFDLENASMSINVRSSFQILLCLLSGYCWGIALKYAGTSNINAKDTLVKQFRFLHCLRDGISPSWEFLEFAYDRGSWEEQYESYKLLTKAQRQKSLKSRLKKLMVAAAEKASRPILEMCLTLIAISVSIICAGSGDLEILRILRALHSKIDDISFGTHMGLAMGVGLLFLAQGKASLKRDDTSIAALILSMCPRYPCRSKDNQSHLQSLRHLYVLAVEERCLQALDVDTGESIPLDVEVRLRSGEKMNLRIPTLLPELSSIESVTSLSPKHFRATIGQTETHFCKIWTNIETSCNCANLFPQVSFPYSFPLRPTLFLKKIQTDNHISFTSLKANQVNHYNCQLYQRCQLESSAFNSALLLGVGSWSHLLCCEVYLLRNLLKTFPCFRTDPNIVSPQTSEPHYSLTKLLSTADAIISAECDLLVANDASVFLRSLLDPTVDSALPRKYSAISLSFALHTIHFNFSIDTEEKYSELIKSLKLEMDNNSKKENMIVSLVNRASLVINNNIELS